MDARQRRGWLEVDNFDLWAALDELLRGRVGGLILFVKVKGHAMMADVRAGSVSLEDKQGNDAADVLARKGAAQHAVDAGYKARMRASKRLAITVQRMMCDIVVARNGAAVSAADGESAVVVPDDDCESMISVISDGSEGSDATVINISSSGSDTGGIAYVPVEDSEHDKDEEEVEAGADDWQASHAAPRVRDPG